MNRQELNMLVRGVAQRFEKETGMSITARVLDALVIPALPHLETVTRELDEGKVTVPFPRRLRPNRPHECPYSGGRTGRKCDCFLRGSRVNEEGMPLLILVLTMSHS